MLARNLRRSSPEEVRWLTAVALLAALSLTLSGCAPTGERDSTPAQQAVSGEKGGQEEFGPYEVVEDWLKPLPDSVPGEHDGWGWGSVASVYAETPDRIWIAMRGEHPIPADAEPWSSRADLSPFVSAMRGERRWHHAIFVVDGDGQLVEAWRHLDAGFDHDGPGSGPHRIKMSPYDSERNVWIIDDNRHVIYKFTHDGELVMTLGELDVAGSGPNNFNRPTDIAWLPDGTMFITDGYGGTRVAKFDADGNFLLDWGSPPADPANPGPSEFSTPHSIAISQDRRIYVMDRGHRRMQVFDENGNFLDMWTTGVRSSPYAHFISTDQHVWMVDGGTNRVLEYDLEGHYLYGWGGPGQGAGQLQGGHDLTVDQDGNLYIAEAWNGRVQKFTPKPGADPAKLVGQIPRPGT